MNYKQIIVNEAKSWVGTKFHHQGRLKYKDNKHPGGTDCIGLVSGVCRELQLVSNEIDKKGNPILLHEFDKTDYAHEPQGQLLKEALDMLFIETSADLLEPGDIVLFKMVTNPQHVGIIVDHPNGYLGLIHALRSAGKVCIQEFDHKWRNRAIAYYQFPLQSKERCASWLR